MPHRELTEHALGLTWESGDGLSRTAHALVDDGRVWLVDPFEDEQALERAAALGEIAGVLQLFVAHDRDAESIAQRFGAPFLKLPEAVPDSPFSIVSLDLLVWKERALWWPQRKGLVVPESVGASELYAVGPGPTGVHLLRRLLPPGQLRGYVPEHLLMGHGPPIHGSEATTALNEALDRSRRDLPTLVLKAPGLIRSMRRQS